VKPLSPTGRGGYRWGFSPQSSPFPLGRGRTKVGDRNFLPQLTPSLYSSPLKRGRKLGRYIPSKKGRKLRGRIKE